MKRYKKLVPSTLVLITLMSSLATETSFADVKISYTGEIDNDDAEIEETVDNTARTTSDAAIEVTSGLPTEKTTESLLRTSTGSAIKPKSIETHEEGGWTYSYNTVDKTATIVATDNKSGDVVVPGSVIINDVEYRVVSLPISFANESGLKSITIPEGVTYIGNEMFYNCVNLESVTLEGDVAHIMNKAFSGCTSLTSIDIPSTVQAINQSTFSGCTSLKEVNLKEGLARVNNEAFKGCTSLTSINLPSTVSFVGEYAFADCKSLKQITIDGTLNEVSAYTFSGCESLEEIAFKDGLTKVYQYAFYGCKSLEKVDLPNTVTMLIEQAFNGCSKLKEIDISSVTSLNGVNMFKGCESLEKVELGNLYLIPPGTFEDCKSLKEIKLPSTLAMLPCDPATGVGVFNDSGLRYISIPATVTKVDAKFINSLVSAETSEPITTAYVNTPFTGKEIDINNILLSDAKGNTLYMKYDITPEIDLNGGQMGADRTFPAWVTADKLAGHIDAPTRVGETFAGWEIVEADTVEGADGSEYIAGCVKLKATWAPKNAVFDPNGGTGNQTAIAQMVDTKFILPDTEPTRDGYEFIGWVDGSDNKITNETVVSSFADGTVFYAKWVEIIKEEPVINTIFDTNDGTSNQTAIAQTMGENFILPTVNPTREGYEFLGWFDSSDKQVTEAMLVDKLEEGTVFYAGWKEIVTPRTTVDIVFDTNDGTSNQTLIPQTIGEKFKLPNTAPTRVGYEFMGWFDTSNNKITNETVVGNLSDGTVIYAKWKAIVVEVPIENPTDDSVVDSDNTNTADKIINNNSNDSVDTAIEQPKQEEPSKILFNAFSVIAGSDEFITLYSDGTVKRTNAYTKTYIDPRTKSMYVSLRGVLDNSIDTVKINWNAKTNTAEVIFANKGTKIVFTANSSIMTVNGVERQMLSAEGEKVEAQLVNGRLMIPLRFVSELFDFNVGYDNNIKRSIVATGRTEK